jgi:hypothetical protein
MDDRSWLERTFGASPETTIPALLGGPVGAGLVVLGLMWDSKEVLGFGIGLMSAAFTVAHVLSRSQAQHERDTSAKNESEGPSTPTKS